jgi:hypothetical protein
MLQQYPSWLQFVDAGSQMYGRGNFGLLSEIGLLTPQ